MRRARAWLVAVLATTAALTFAATPAQATAPGTTSLAQVLLADGDDFDSNPDDFDITTQAVLAVLAAKPDSKVGVLTDGTVPLTAFVPTDQAFRLLVQSLTGQTIASEQDVFNAVASLGIDTVEAVLLYHVVPGVTITKEQALQSDLARLRTASGGTFRVDITRLGVQLRDRDRDSRNPLLTSFDINAGNLQIAHGIDRVLRPTNLPG